MGTKMVELIEKQSVNIGIVALLGLIIFGCSFSYAYGKSEAQLIAQQKEIKKELDEHREVDKEERKEYLKFVKEMNIALANIEKELIKINSKLPTK